MSPALASLRRSNRSARGPVTNTSNADGRELGEPEQPERELAAGEVEHLLAEHDGERGIAVDEHTTDVRSATTERVCASTGVILTPVADAGTAGQA